MSNRRRTPNDIAIEIAVVATLILLFLAAVIPAIRALMLAQG